MRTFDEARAELERRNYKVIAPFFVANKVRVQRPDGSEVRVRDQFDLVRWAREELGIIDPPASGTPSPNPPETIDDHNSVSRSVDRKGGMAGKIGPFIGFGFLGIVLGEAVAIWTSFNDPMGARGLGPGAMLQFFIMTGAGGVIGGSLWQKRRSGRKE
ncbi:MAG TPA: hypothetical protein VNV39_03495 [Stellaceae bacterium]|nr:hypothetical protein [Stellaceae bacterium]